MISEQFFANNTALLSSLLKGKGARVSLAHDSGVTRNFEREESINYKSCQKSQACFSHLAPIFLRKSKVKKEGGVHEAMPS